MPEAFLEVTDLKTHFPHREGFPRSKNSVGTVKAVDGIDLTLAKGEVLGLVGESGCGKSTLGRTILQLIPPTAGNVVLAGATSPAERFERPCAKRAGISR